MVAERWRHRVLSSRRNNHFRRSLCLAYQTVSQSDFCCQPVAHVGRLRFAQLVDFHRYTASHRKRIWSESVASLDRYFPTAFGRIHLRWRTPYVAIIVQAAIATLLLLAFVFSKERGAKSVGQAYLILLSAQVFIYFILHIYLFFVFLIHRRKDSEDNVMLSPGGTRGAYLLALSGLSVTIFAVALTFIPPSDADMWNFEIRLIGGIAALLALDGLLYKRANKTK